MRCLIIHNPASGPSSDEIYAFTHALAQGGDEVVMRFIGDGMEPEDAVADVREFDRVVVSGGDGTVSNVLDQMRGCGVPTLVFPSGTACLFFNNIGNAPEAAALAKACRAGRTVKVDMGELFWLDESVTKVFHACSQDMEVMLHTVGALPRPIFDTQVAAAFLGERQQISYGALVQAFCGVSLPKTESLTDWSRRPLTDKQIEYAIDDVKYLIVAYTEMMSRLRELGRVDWVLDELRPLADESHYRADRHEAFRKVKRINSCSRHQLGIARELAAWREDRAERRNIPRKWVMSDDTLLALVKRNPVRVEEFRSIRGTDQLGERDVDGALMAIKRGASCPHDRLPLMVRGHRQISPELESVTDLMYALIRLVAERSGVATSVIASRDDLADYIEHPEQSPLREGWRFELVGSRLDDLLSGNMGLTVKDGKIELL